MDKRSTESNENQFWNQISSNVLVRFLLLFASGWALLTVFNYFENILFTFSVAAILAFLLNYPVRYLKRFLGRGFARGIVIVVTLVIIISLIVALGLSVLHQLEQLIALITERLSSPESSLDKLTNFLAGRNINIDFTRAEQLIENALTSSINFLITALSSLPNTILNFIFILVISFFMLVDGEKLWLLILKLIPIRQRDRFTQVIQQSFWGFFHRRRYSQLARH